MITLTIQEILDGAGGDGDQHSKLYIFRNSETMLYVGMSTRGSLVRIHEHLLPFGSSVGQFVKDHMPNSLNWQVDLLTLEDAVNTLYPETSVKKIAQAKEDRRRDVTEHNRKVESGDWLALPGRLTEDFAPLSVYLIPYYDLRDVEHDLIRHHRPLLNEVHNFDDDGTDWMAKYQSKIMKRRPRFQLRDPTNRR